MYRINVLIAEDEERLRQVIVKYLENEGYHVEQAMNGEEALAIFQERPIDLAILDIMMPKADGWYVLKKIRETSKIPVIMLTARNSEEDTLFGFELGADDYVGKPFRVRELMARIKALLVRAGKRSGETRLVAGHLTIDTLARRVILAGEEIELTPKEYDMLLYLVTNAGHVLSREQLLNRVWGYDYYGEERSVDTLIKRLRKKMGQEEKRLKTVRGVGYRFDG